MATIALFHSVLGLRPGMYDAADRLRAAGHEVHLVDLFDGLVFDDYEPALHHAEEEVGHQALMRASLEATRKIPGPLVVAGFSLGCASAEHVAVSRPEVVGALLFAGAASLEWFDKPWPPGVPAQTHSTLEDPWREQDQIDAFAAQVRAAGGEVEVFDYPGSGHLFADPSKVDEFQPEEAALMWRRVLEFLDRVG